MSKISRTGQEHCSIEGSSPSPLRPTRRKMFRSRRELAAAAGFWVLLVAAAIGTSVVPGATAAASSGMTVQQQVTYAGSWVARATSPTRREGPRRPVKTLNSRNAYPVGLSDESNNCTLTRSGLGDTFTLQPDSTRCTWTNSSFSHMGRHEIFVVKLRFDDRPPQHVEWENEINLRPEGDFGNEDCASGGNHEVMLLRLWVDRRHSRDVWRLDIRGGTSLNLSDQVVKTLKLGPIVVGKTLALKFDIIADYLHGAASVWQNGKRIYANRDRPVGFHYDCDRTTDISNFPLRMQHGVYREGGGPATLTSSGFRFLLSRWAR
jgi:hypothetical protein